MAVAARRRARDAVGDFGASAAHEAPHPLTHHLLKFSMFLDVGDKRLLLALHGALLALQLADGSVDEPLGILEDLSNRLLLPKHVPHVDQSNNRLIDVSRWTGGKDPPSKRDSNARAGLPAQERA
jgi:hypothetical protein